MCCFDVKNVSTCVEHVLQAKYVHYTYMIYIRIRRDGDVYTTVLIQYSIIITVYAIYIYIYGIVIRCAIMCKQKIPYSKCNFLYDNV